MPTKKDVATKTTKTTKSAKATKATKATKVEKVAKVAKELVVDKKIKKDKQNPVLRIKLKGYDVKMLEASLSKVVGLLIKSGADIKGPMPLPKKRKLYTVLRSNFKHKDAREQFERMTYSRMIDVVKTGSKTMEYLQNLSIPVGVLVDVKVF